MWKPRVPALLVLLALCCQPVARAEDTTGVTAARTIEADGSTTLVHEVLVPALPAEVWHMVSTAEGWMRWAVPIAWQDTAGPGTLETSYDPAASPGAPGTIQQQFVAAIPGRMLAFRTIKTPEDFPHAATYMQVVSIFELSAEGTSTRVRLTAVNYPATPAGQQLADFFMAGNGASLVELQRIFLR